MMHQEIECPREEWGVDYLLYLMKAHRDKVCDHIEAAFLAEPVSYAMARKADADCSPWGRCDALDKDAFGIEFYVCNQPSK